MIKTVVHLTVTSARVLDAEERNKIDSVFAKKYDDPIDAEYLVDDSLIGGIMVFDGKTVYNGSVKSKLERLKERLGDEK